MNGMKMRKLLRPDANPVTALGLGPLEFSDFDLLVGQHGYFVVWGFTGTGEITSVSKIVPLSIETSLPGINTKQMQQTTVRITLTRELPLCSPLAYWTGIQDPSIAWTF